MKTPTCLNLKRKFGKKYRVEYEESYYCDRSIRSVEDPWLMIILCQAGHIYPHGGKLLAAATDKRGTFAKRLAALSCTEVIQDGTDGINAIFDAKHFDEVAKVMRPKRKKQLSQEHKDKLVAAGQAALKRKRETQ